MKLFISPHNDDEVLFGAFTIMREKPLVMIVYDSYLQQRSHPECDATTRREESLKALEELGCPRHAVRFLGFQDHGNYSAGQITSAIQRALGGAVPEITWGPACEAAGHEQHNLVSTACLPLGGERRWYMTYTRPTINSAGGKTRTDRPVEIESGEWIRRKLRALACYQTQIDIEALGCRPHFMADLNEYYA